MTKKEMNMIKKIVSEHINDAWEDGAREERQNVVAWLRREASAMHPAEPDRPMLSHSERSLLLVFAACIERGGHDHEVASG
jgi:hypothetical protein